MGKMLANKALSVASFLFGLLWRGTGLAWWGGKSLLSLGLGILGIPTGGTGMLAIGAAALLMSSLGGGYVGWKAHAYFVSGKELASLKRDIELRERILLDRETALLADLKKTADLEANLERLRNASVKNGDRVCIDANDPWLRGHVHPDAKRKVPAARSSGRDRLSAKATP